METEFNDFLNHLRLGSLLLVKIVNALPPSDLKDELLGLSVSLHELYSEFCETYDNANDEPHYSQWFDDKIVL